MLRVYFVFILLFFINITQVKSQNFKDERRVYLLDCTLSMFGFGGCPEIFEEVRAGLIEAIQTIDDERTEIIILPFQDEVLDVWKQDATASGKKILIDKIRSIKKKNLDITRTNICAAWEKALELLNSERRNYIFLLTDGEQNSKKNTKDCLYSHIENWCSQARQRDAFAFYVMLTEAANDPKLKAIINSCNRIEFVEGTDIDIIELRPSSTSIPINVREQKYSASLPFVSNHIDKLPSGFKIKLQLEDNPYFSLTDIDCSKINNGVVNFSLNPKILDDEILRMPLEFNIPLKIIIDNNKFPRIFSTPSQINVLLKNKREKVLTIKIIEDENN
ncbi:VWA domain-containing protein [Labilibaculum sp. DW002]|uniref:VWA domain-containing protein n=1 Tax=Paralabilibaculum antarcticum TaxID=2912572 RepID=A0ABT5VT84_9BACT|nr:vWA domain-containing protein [Labilibaculum sp. DW002]MDE5418470.1 VWA domain-containing protein [Labilibaculum sp. DW002]